MMNAKELRVEFEAALKEIQDCCMHQKSEWMDNSYAPGHTLGSVRVCLNCEKVLERM